ncbi:MAG: pilus assembly protein PilM [Candidatus Omnitrophica bacterium]|nr:pilus assembly protein PilM [Candidatus Omnitrophota bacterium]
MEINKLPAKLFANTAIYMSADFVDIVKAEATFKGVRIAFLQRYPILKDIKDMEDAETWAEVEKALSMAFKEARPEKVALNVMDRFLLLRRFSFKKVPESELKKVIVFEAQKYVPYPMESLVFGFEKCGKRKDLQEILFVAVETKNIDHIVEYFKGKNIIASIIEPTPGIIANILCREAHIEKEKAYISVHYEPSNKIVITGIVGQAPYFFRDINIVSGEDEFKTTELRYPSVTDLWGAIQQDVLGAIEYVKKEAKKDIEKIFISGFSFNETEKKMQEDLEMPVERLKFSRFDFESTDDYDRYMPALSLAYDAVHRPTLNLAPRAIVENDIASYKPMVARAGIFLCAILGLHIFLAAVNLAQNVKIKNIDRNVKKHFNISTVVNAGSPEEDIARYKKFMEERAVFVYSALSDKIYVTEKLNRLGRDMPPNAWITSVNLRNFIQKKRAGSLTIKGAVYVQAGTGASEINDIIESIKNDSKMMKGFKDVKLISLKKKELSDKEITEFEIILT